jgi:hypothetical protein
MAAISSGILFIYDLPLGMKLPPTLVDHVASFRSHSGFATYYVNIDLGFPTALLGLDFEIIVLHYSLFYRPPYPISPEMIPWLAGSQAYKVAFFQDEYQFCPHRYQFVNQAKLDAVYTCYPARHHAQTYGKHTKVQTIKTYIPGHISEAALAAATRCAKPDQSRSRDIGYRGRPLPFHLGRGGYDKTRIGFEFLARASDSGLKMDIKLREEDRIYGDDWYRFLGDCKGVLGVESGATLSDADGTVEKACTRLLKEQPGLSFEQVYQSFLEEHDGKLPLLTIAPRHLEAALFRCCQVLFRGDYSGLMQPMVHYIPLEKDFSNLDEVIRLFKDQTVRRQLTDACYTDLVASGRYTYQAFMADFDRLLKYQGFRPHDPDRNIRKLLKKHLKAQNHITLAAKRLLRGLKQSFPGKSFLRPWADKYLPQKIRYWP